jgi:predicted transcriptional regulator
MPKTATMTVRVSPQGSERLAALACDTNRSKAYLAGAAIADFVERNALQVARITAALEDARSARPGIPH